MTDSFSRAIWISVLGHGIVVTLIFLRAVVMPVEPFEIKNAIRVDIVGLPEKAAEFPTEPAKPVAKPEVKEVKPVPPTPKPEVKADVPTVPDKTKKKDLSKSQQKAMEKLKAMSALEKIKQDLKREKDAKAETSKVVKGNQVSEGDSPTGMERLDFDRYLSEVRATVAQHNSVPQWLADGGYRTIIRVFIDERGFIVKKVIEGPSGNEVFDAKAIEAVEASSPLPPPPQRLRARAASIGLLFRFPQ
ncbi:MAG: TonB family protein [Bdellovibrionales bacterium]|nr:TonB family protein [Bdellovibrionales bacterium]